MLLPLAILLTVATYQGFANSSVAETLTNIIRPFFSLFASNAGPVARPTPFLQIEQNATSFAILIAVVLCCLSAYGEARLIQSHGKNSASAAVISLSFVLLALNATLLVWNT